jgi:hypothetical protein
MGPGDVARTWDLASSPVADRLVGRYRRAWGNAPEARPDPSDFLPDDPSERPGALLALLRADLAIRLGAGEPLGAEWYLDRYPDLDGDARVALIYEEFCLREEAGEAPDPAEYEARFPELAGALREVLDIHGLVRSAGRAIPGETAAVAPFPGVGQVIAEFRLVEELGRGAFARVFLAEERTLGGRRVALKVARLARAADAGPAPAHQHRPGLLVPRRPRLGPAPALHALPRPPDASRNPGRPDGPRLGRRRRAGRGHRSAPVG